MNKPKRLITKEEVLFRVPCGYRRIVNLMRNGDFPLSREVGRRVVWIEDEIDAWIAQTAVTQLDRSPETLAMAARARAGKRKVVRR
jgi:predicted DNA-binding transcriptional regulator AlpA